MTIDVETIPFDAAEYLGSPEAQTVFFRTHWRLATQDTP